MILFRGKKGSRQGKFEDLKNQRFEDSKIQLAVGKGQLAKGIQRFEDSVGSRQWAVGSQ